MKTPTSGHRWPLGHQALRHISGNESGDSER